jgi:archaellum component FlaC
MALSKTDLSKIGQIVEEKVKPVDTRVKSVEKDVSGLKQDMNAVKKDVSGLKQNMNAVKKDVSGLKQNMNAVKKDVKKIKKDTKTIVDYFDKSVINLHKRTKRIEKHLDLPPISEQQFL